MKSIKESIGCTRIIGILVSENIKICENFWKMIITLVKRAISLNVKSLDIWLELSSIDVFWTLLVLVMSSLSQIIKGLLISSSELSSLLRISFQKVRAIAKGMISITNKVFFGLKPMVVSNA